MNIIKWTPQEDEFLQNFNENNQNLSWEQIAFQISQKLNLPKKLGKQCQQRLKQLCGTDSIFKIDWTYQQEALLIQKHRQMGNKWAAISLYLIGKNDNCVKNHFYSRLRKMIRKLNRIIQFYFKKVFKSIPNATIYKLVEASQEKFKQKPICAEEVSIICQDVISKMLKISVQEEYKTEDTLKLDKQSLDQYKQLIEQINTANKNYKKKSKKIKNSTIKAPIRKSKPNKMKKAQISIQQDFYKADQSQSQSQKQEVQKQQKFPSNSQRSKSYMEDQNINKHASFNANLQKRVEVKEGDEMQQLLKNIGLLHEGKKDKQQPDKKSQYGNNSMKSYSDFENPSEDLSFFEDSNNCWKKQSKMFSKINKNLFGDNSSQIEGS